MNEKKKAEKLHGKARHYNWDNGMDGLYDIIQDEHCDKATALMIFWMGRPEWDLQYENRDEVDSFRLEEYDFLENLLLDYLGGNFDDRQSLHFDPADDNGEDWTNEYPDLVDKFKREIPEIMYEPV